MSENSPWKTDGWNNAFLLGLHLFKHMSYVFLVVLISIRKNPRMGLFIRELMDNQNPIPFPPHSLCIVLLNINVDPNSLHFSIRIPHHVHHCSSKSWNYQPGCINFLIENLFHFYTLYRKIYIYRSSPICLHISPPYHTNTSYSRTPPNQSALGASKELLRSY